MKMLDQKPACQILSYQSASEELQRRQVSRVLSTHKAENSQWTSAKVSQSHRAVRNGHASMVITLTGACSEEISAIAAELERTLFNRGKQVYFLASEPIHERLRDQVLPATNDVLAEQAELTRRHAQMAHILADAGLIVITGSFSPYQSDREMAHRLLAPHNHLEVFVNSYSPDAGEKGRYTTLKRVDFSSVTPTPHGHDDYEAPEHPVVEVDAHRESAAESVGKILWCLAKLAQKS